MTYFSVKPKFDTYPMRKTIPAQKKTLAL